MGFKVFEEGGAIDAEGDVREGPFFGELGLFYFFFEEDLLLAERAVGGEGGLDFTEGEEGDAGVVFDLGAVLVIGGTGASVESSALIDGLGKGCRDGVDEVIWIQDAAEGVGSIRGTAGEAEGGEEVFAGGLSVLGGGEKLGAGCDEIGASFDELGGKSDGDFVREVGEIERRGDGSRGVSAEENFEVASGVIAVELPDAEGALGGGDVVAGELDIDGSEGVRLVATLDNGKGLLVGGDGFLSEGELLLGGDEVTP